MIDSETSAMMLVPSPRWYTLFLSALSVCLSLSIDEFEAKTPFDAKHSFSNIVV